MPELALVFALMIIGASARDSPGDDDVDSDDGSDDDSDDDSDDEMAGFTGIYPSRRITRLSRPLRAYIGTIA
jgi:hypothetical protein